MIHHFWDWDDSIAMSRNALYLSYKKVLEEYDKIIDFEYFNNFIYQDSGIYLSEVCNFSEKEIIKIKKKKEDFYFNFFFNDIRFIWPEYDINEKYYIVSNTNTNLIKKLIKKYDSYHNSNHLEKFQILGTSSNCKEVIKRKPAPDLYINAFDMWINKMNSDDLLHIYEDSPEGLKSAADFAIKYKNKITNLHIHHVKNK